MTTTTPVLASPPEKVSADGEWVFVQFGINEKDGEDIENTFQKAEVDLEGGAIENKATEGQSYEARWFPADTPTFALLPTEEDTSNMKVVKGPVKWLRVGKKPRRAGPYHSGDRFLTHLQAGHEPSLPSASRKLQFDFVKSENVPVSQINDAPTCVASFEFPVRDLDSLTFTRQDVRVAKRERRRSLQTDRKNVQYTGELCPRDDKIYLGTVRKKRLALFPTEYYTMKVRIPSEDAENQNEPEKTFLELRDETIDLFAAAKRKKLVKEAKKKRITDEEIANLQDTKEGLQAKIDQNMLSEGHMDAATEEAMRKVLPAWNAAATNASEIYAEGLDKIFPPDFMESLSYPAMLIHAQKASFFKNRTDRDLWSATQSKTVHAILKRRHLAHITPENEQEGKTFARKMQVILSMLWTYRLFRNSKGFASKLEAEKKVIKALRDLPSSSVLASTIANVFFEESGLTMAQRDTNGQTCILETKKLLCHLIVYILSCVPKAQFEFRDVASDLQENVDALRVYLEYVGCVVNTNEGGLEATLKNTFALRKPRVRMGGKKKKRR